MIFVFKTSVKTKAQVKQLNPHLDSVLPKAKWSFDLGDCDRILRMYSDEDIFLAISRVLKVHHFSCGELE